MDQGTVAQGFRLVHRRHHHQCLSRPSPFRRFTNSRVPTGILPPTTSQEMWGLQQGTAVNRVGSRSHVMGLTTTDTAGVGPPAISTTSVTGAEAQPMEELTATVTHPQGSTVPLWIIVCAYLWHQIIIVQLLCLHANDKTGNYNCIN